MFGKHEIPIVYGLKVENVKWLLDLYFRWVKLAIENHPAKMENFLFLANWL